MSVSYSGEYNRLLIYQLRLIGGSSPLTLTISGCRVTATHLLWAQGQAGSTPVVPTMSLKEQLPQTDSIYALFIGNILPSDTDFVPFLLSLVLLKGRISNTHEY